MARTVLPFVGAAVGFWIGGPTGAQVGFALGGVVGNAIDPIKNIGPRIGETGAQTSAEGAPRGIVYGTAHVTGNVISSGPLIKADIESQEGKGGPVNVQEHCYRTYAIRICEGPIGGVLRIWEDDKLVYDIRTGSAMLEESAKWYGVTTTYLGDETQIPNPFLEINVDPDTPAHRGTAYMVFAFRDLTDRRGSIPQYRFEVASAASFTPGEDTTILAPLEAAPMWRAQTFSAGLTSYAADEETAVYASGEKQANLPGYGNLVECLIDGLPEDNTWRCYYDNANLQNFETQYVNWKDVPAGFTLVTGTAKQLADVEYRSGTVYQDGLGPVLLPGDPNYDNAEFWENQRVMAISAGTLMPDVDSPVEVPQYGMRVETGGGTADGEPVTLASIVSDLHARCGVSASEFDVSELDDMVGGLVLAGEYSGSDAINTLRGPYFFDKTEADKKLWYPKRGAAVVETLTIDDLIDEPDTQMREQAVEYPRNFHLFYQHARSGYAAVKATSQRSSPDARVVGEMQTQVPVVFAGAEDEAAQTAAKMHKVAWAEAEGEVTFSVPWSFLRLVPSNPIGFVLRGRVNRLRIATIDLNDGVMSLICRHDRQSAYTSNVTGVPIPEPTPPPSTIVGSTVLAVLDIPSRLDSEDDLNIYYGVTGGQPAWYGAMVQRSLDGGATYTNALSTSRAQVMGYLLADVADASEDFTDTTNTLSVRLYRANHTLESISETQFLSEGGAFALEKADGSWEIMQARDWVEDSAGDWTGSTLHRGRLNSGTSAHASGMRLVMLDRVEHVEAQSSWIGQSLTHRAPSFDQAPELATEQTATYVGRSQTEWPVASLTLARDGADIITGSWAPRHRFGTDDAPVASINFRGYRVTIDGSVSFDTVDPSFSYDASALSDPLVVTVAALNRITGAGPAESGIV